MKKYSTTNYGKFSFLPFNRDYTIRPTLMESFRKYGWLVPIVCGKSDVFGKELLYVIDGQNRLAAAKALDLPIEYVVREEPITTIEDLVNITAMLNSSAVAWGLKDYVKTYCQLNNNDYIVLDRLSSSYSVSVSNLAQLLTGSLDRRSGESIKDGSFAITRYDETIKMLGYITELRKITKFHGRIIQGFATFYKSLGEPFNMERFKTNLQGNLPILADISEAPQIAKMFDRIYHIKEV